MTYEVGTHIPFQTKPALQQPRRLYDVGAKVLFVKVADALVLQQIPMTV